MSLHQLPASTEIEKDGEIERGARDRERVGWEKEKGREKKGGMGWGGLVRLTLSSYEQA